MSGKFLNRAGLAASKDGFTLLEMVIAVGILGIALVVIIRGYAVTLRSLDYAAGRMTAFMLAENLLVEYELEGEFSEGYDSGVFEGGFESFRWERTVSPLQYEEEIAEGVLRVQISVFRNRDVEASLVTFVEGL